MAQKFPPAGNKRHLDYTAEYLRRHVAIDGSTITMTKNGYIRI